MTDFGFLSFDLSDMQCSQLQEFGSKYEAETLRNSKKTDIADVIVYVHDSSDTNSFSYISNLRVSDLSRATHFHLDYVSARSNNTVLITYPRCLLRQNLISTLRSKLVVSLFICS
jgi:hypothetical protein